MLHIFTQAFSMLLQPGSLLAMLVGMVVGLIVGVVPGIGGPFALALLMPLTYTMDPVFGIVMLVTLVSVVGNGGSVSAILIGVPGTPTNAATVMDGYQMTRNGEAGRALAACLTTSAVGGVFGALVLILIMPVMRAVILSFGHPELFMIAVLGISFVAVLGEGSLLKSLTTAAVGFVVALIGYDPVSGVPRYDLGIIYLYDGIKILPITLGLFAMPEMMGLYADLQSGEAKTFTQKEVWQGVKDVFEHWFLVVRCSILGTLVGMVPGLGAEAATFLAYAHAKQSSKHPERFGHGSVEGVIGPETANNAKEGGALVPTLGFGIPGSVVMAILISAFTILGLQPGPTMMKNQPELIMIIALLTGLTNVVGSGVCLLAAKWLVKLASVRAKILVPWILMLITVGAYVPNSSYVDVIITISFGLIGIAMKAFKYPRVVLLMVVVLAKPMEMNFWMGLQYFGMAMFMRPIVLVFFGLIIITFGVQYHFASREELKTT